MSRTVGNRAKLDAAAMGETRPARGFRRLPGLIMTAALAAVSMRAAWAAEEDLWQQETQVDRGLDRQGRPRPPEKAFLWIPPNCEQVRGMIIGQKTLLEKSFTADPIIRNTAAELDLAIVYLEPGFDALFNDIKRPEHKPAPYAEYTGDKSEAFWHFDEEIALATFEYHNGKFDK